MKIPTDFIVDHNQYFEKPVLSLGLVRLVEVIYHEGVKNEFHININYKAFSLFNICFYLGN